jgi:large subunit ribosomal protein L1
MKQSKNYRAAKAAIDPTKQYPISEAVPMLQELATAKFDETFEIAIKTFANPKYNDQIIRATVTLPHGTGKSLTVAAFVSEDKIDEAKKAGADIAGKEDLLTMIKEGNTDFDVLITSPDMMRDLAPIAKILGPKGLMPSPKAGTITPNVMQAIDEIKKGRIEFRLDKTGNIHAIVGKKSFSAEQLEDNINAFLKAVQDNKPSGVKGKLFKKVVLSTTMSPGIQLDVTTEQ